MILSLTIQYITYGEYPAGQGFMDMYIQKAANSLAKYEAIVELKYLKEKARQKENLKKFVIIFKGFEEYYVEEII